MEVLEEDVVALMRKRVYDLSGVLGKTVKVQAMDGCDLPPRIIWEAEMPRCQDYNHQVGFARLALSSTNKLLENSQSKTKKQVSVAAGFCTIYMGYMGYKLHKVHDILSSRTLQLWHTWSGWYSHPSCVLVECTSYDICDSKRFQRHVYVMTRESTRRCT